MPAPVPLFFEVVLTFMGLGAVLFIVLLVMRLSDLNKLHPRQLRRRSEGDADPLIDPSLPTSDASTSGSADATPPSETSFGGSHESGHSGSFDSGSFGGFDGGGGGHH